MTRDFPFLTQQTTQTCVYLTPNSISDELTEGLERSIRAGPGGRAIQAFCAVQEVIQHLTQRYGGLSSNYPYWKISKTAYRIQLPPGLDRARTINEIQGWGLSKNWEFNFWNDDETTHTQPKLYRVRIKITNFPYNFWSPSFIKQVISHFGEVEHIDEANICGVERAAIYVWVECIDPKRIPFSSILPFGDKWKECFFSVMGWQYMAWIPPEARYTSQEEDEEQGTAQSNDLEGQDSQARGSLLAAHDRLMNYLAGQRRSPAVLDQEISSRNTLVHHPHGAPEAPVSQEKTKQERKVEPKVEPRGKGSMSYSHFWNLKEETDHKEALLEKGKKTGPSSEKEEIRVGDFTIIQQRTEPHTASQPGKWQTFSKVIEKETITVGEIIIISHMSVTINIGQMTISPHVAVPYGELIQSQIDTSPHSQTNGKSPWQESAENHKFFQPNMEINLHPPTEPIKNSNHHKVSSPLIKQPEASQNNTLSPTDHNSKPKPTKEPMENENFSSDDEFITKFAALSGQDETQPLQLTQGELNTRDWSLTGVVRVVSDRNVIDGNFISTMRKAWGTQPETEISPLARNIYLVQFVSQKDMNHVMGRGIWLYRSDAVILQRVHGPSDLINPSVPNAEVWVQLHHILLETVSKEGILSLAGRIGPPLSEVTTVIQGNLKFYKVKILVSVDKKLVDRLKVEHPELGVLLIYLSYERLNRICRFCALIGHEHTNCPDKQRMERLRVDPRYRDKPEMKKLTKPRLGPWINDPTVLPSKDQTEQSQSLAQGMDSQSQPQNQTPHTHPQNPNNQQTYNQNQTDQTTEAQSQYAEPSPVYFFGDYATFQTNQNEPHPNQSIIPLQTRPRKPRTPHLNANRTQQQHINQNQNSILGLPPTAQIGYKRTCNYDEHQTVDGLDLSLDISYLQLMHAPSGDTHSSHARKKRTVEASRDSSPPQ